MCLQGERRMSRPLHQDRPRVKGDGNCLFRALTYPRDDQMHAMLRKALVSHVRSHWDDFVPLLDEGERSGYCARMSCNGEWGDEIMLRAFADAFRRHVVVSDRKGRTVSVYGSLRFPTVALVFSGCHYDPA